MTPEERKLLIWNPGSDPSKEWRYPGKGEDEIDFDRLGEQITEAIRAAEQEARKEEREACARACTDLLEEYPSGVSHVLFDCAAAIRARSGATEPGGER